MLEAGTMLLFCAVLFASVALGWSIIPALFVGVLLFMGYGLVRRCSLRAMASRAAGSVRSAGTVVVALRAHRRTDLAVAGQRDHRLHRGPFDRGDSRRHGDSAVVSTVLGDVGAGRVVVRQCGDYGHHLHVVGIVDAGEPGDARWRDSCGRLCGRSLFAGFHQCLAGQTAYAYEPVQYYCPHAAHGCGAVCAELCGIRCGCGGGVAVRERWFRIWCG